ncbi:MAG: hypothetical protein WC781_04925 [Candidatus Pacearchaeota archaeon]|jgi:hypothetical protein
MRRKKLDPYFDKSRDKRIESLTENLMGIVSDYPELKQNDIALYPISAENAPVYSRLCGSIKGFVIDEIYAVMKGFKY